MGAKRKLTEAQLAKIKQWVRLHDRIGTRQQLAGKLGLSEPTLSRYIRAIKYGVVDQPFNQNGYILNGSKTGFIGAKPRRKKAFVPITHHCALRRTGGEGYVHLKHTLE